MLDQFGRKSNQSTCHVLGFSPVRMRRSFEAKRSRVVERKIVAITDKFIEIGFVCGTRKSHFRTSCWDGLSPHDLVTKPSAYLSNDDDKRRRRSLMPAQSWSAATTLGEPQQQSIQP